MTEAEEQIGPEHRLLYFLMAPEIYGFWRKSKKGREGDSPVVQVQSRCDGLCASPSPCLRVYGIVPVQSSPAFSTGTGLRTLSPKQVLRQKKTNIMMVSVRSTKV